MQVHELHDIKDWIDDMLCPDKAAELSDAGRAKGALSPLEPTPGVYWPGQVQVLKAANGKLGRALAGDFSDYGGDQSRADAGVCSILAKDGYSMADIDQIIRHSALMRPKWDSKRGDSTYGRDTLEKFTRQASRPQKPSDLELAKKFCEDMFTGEQGRELQWYRDEFYVYTGTHYKVLPKSELVALVLLWLDARIPKTKVRHATDVVSALAAVCRIPYDVELPVYSERGTWHRKDWLAMGNGIIDLQEAMRATDLTLLPNTPGWISRFALPYDYDPDARSDLWFATLNEIFDGDEQAIAFLGEWFGYNLVNDTRHHAVLLMEGPPRSGKSTLLRLLEYIIGKENCCHPRLASLAETFGLMGLVGKRSAICADAHLGHGSRALAILETIKAISGEDTVDVHRKHLPPLTDCKLGVRFSLAVNDLPKFGDDAGALAARVHILPLRRSFLGREDRDRTPKLIGEAPGIFLWAMDGLRRLREQGRFTTVDAAKEIEQDFALLCSPVKAFVEECCEVGADKEVARDDLWTAWVAWCKGTGHLAGSRERFGAVLRNVVPGLKSTRPRDQDGLRQWKYVGLTFL